MNRDRMRTVVAIVVIAAMVLLAVGAVGASLLGGTGDRSGGGHVDATGIGADGSAAVVAADATTEPLRALGT